MGELEAHEKSGKFKGHGTDGVDAQLSQIAIDAVLRTCTPVQQRRFELHHVHGYTLEEVGRLLSVKKNDF
jgi:DNA-directed RNA polymerase specialized sigma24 family protein